MHIGCPYGIVLFTCMILIFSGVYVTVGLTIAIQRQFFSS